MNSLSHWRLLARVPARRFAKTNAAPAKQNIDIEGWLNVLQSKAKTSEGKSLSVQLASLIHYYNRKFEESEKSQIDWDAWKKRIQTKNLVDKIKANVDSIVNEKYEMKEPSVQAKGTATPHEEAINKELAYFKTIWCIFYEDNLRQHVSMKFIPRLTDVSFPELMDLFPAENRQATRLNETAVQAFWAYDDNPLNGYILNQFNWGRRMTTYFRHPTDDFRGVKGTRTIMGR